jgi:hypothetical protein
MSSSAAGSSARTVSISPTCIFESSTFVCITGDGQNNPLASNIFPDSEIIIHLTLFLD